MEIKPLLNTNYLPKDVVNKKAMEEAESQTTPQVDKLELSKEAQLLHKVDGKDFVKIQDKINNGFYNSDNVIGTVAKALIKDLKM